MAPVAAKKNIKTGNVNMNAKDKLHQVQQSNSNISLMLYLHREELRKRKPNLLRKAYMKLQLTHELITKTVRDADKCTSEDLHNINRETVYKNKLRLKINRVKQYHAEKDQKHLRQQLKQHFPQEKQQTQQLLPVQQNRNEEKTMSAKVNKIRRKLF